MTDNIRSERAPAAVGVYPHARRHGNLLFLSGLGSRPAGGGPVPADFEAQVHAVFENVRIVLEDAGAAWSDLLDVTVFLTDIRADFDTFNRVWAEYFDVGGPCRTTVEVDRLPTPIAIELKCIAALRG